MKRRQREGEVPKLVVAVDVVLLTMLEGSLRVGLVKRTTAPQTDWYALPGGVVRAEESLDDAATRVLAEKAGLSGVFLEQLYTFGAPRRDPRNRSISVTYYALVDAGRLRSDKKADDRLEFALVRVPWSGETGGPIEVANAQQTRVPLAFDHAEIIATAIKRIRGKLDYAPIGFQLLPDTFTLRRLQEVHEVILGRRLNKDSFRRRMLASGALEPTGEREEEVGHRPAELYRITTKSAV